MKFAVKLIVCAILSFSVGIACASPLLVSELSIRPWITYVQGPTADMTVNVVYANFTLQNPNTPISRDNGPTLSYYAVINVTNPSEFEATVSRVGFLAAQQIVNNSGIPSDCIFGQSWQAKGAWLDGKWYNLTWVNVSPPSFDMSGNMSLIHVLPGQDYWIEGVQVYDRYVSGALVATYMNMNGTWTDVTGRITVERPTGNKGFGASGMVANEVHLFENTASREYPSHGTTYDQPYGATLTVYHLVGNETLFDNRWSPHQSRLLVIAGSWDLREGYADAELVATLQSDNLMFQTEVSNNIFNETKFVDNTVTSTWSQSTELKQVHLTHTENSYVYTTLPNPVFRIDQWGMEAFLK